MQLTEEQRNELIEIRSKLNEDSLKLKWFVERQEFPEGDPVLNAADLFRQGLAQLSLALDRGPATWKAEQSKPTPLR